jgi:hypothetical protein
MFASSLHALYALVLVIIAAVLFVLGFLKFYPPARI